MEVFWVTAAYYLMTLVVFLFMTTFVTKAADRSRPEAALAAVVVAGAWPVIPLVFILLAIGYAIIGKRKV